MMSEGLIHCDGALCSEDERANGRDLWIRTNQKTAARNKIEATLRYTKLSFLVTKIPQ